MKIIYIPLVALLATPAAFALSQTSSVPDNERSAHMASGSIETIDLTTGKIQLKTDMGKAIWFEAVAPHLLKDLARGDRITLEMDEQGKVIKLMKKSAIPELK